MVIDGAVAEWFRPGRKLWGVTQFPWPILGLMGRSGRSGRLRQGRLPAPGEGGPRPLRPQGARADMAAPAYPAWVTRWVSGQWRNKKRPPALRPPRPLALADKVANRREQLTGELPAAGSGGEGKAGPGPASAAPGAEPPLCPGKGRAAGGARRCLVLHRAAGGRGRAGPWNSRPGSVGRIAFSHCNPKFASYVSQARCVLALPLP